MSSGESIVAAVQRGSSANTECHQLVMIYGGGIDGLLDDIASGLSRNDIAKKIGTSVRTLSRYINESIPESELQAAVDCYYGGLISEGIDHIRTGEDSTEIKRGKILVDAALAVAQFESPKYRPVKTDTKITKIIVGGLAGFNQVQEGEVVEPEPFESPIQLIEQGDASDPA